MSYRDSKERWYRMKEENELNWLEKCITCQHCGKKKDDDDIIYCRKRNGKCEYKPYKKVRKSKKK